MDTQRKLIILKEIEYWKENRLLPEHYCNYLLTLYSEGNHPIENHARDEHQKSKKGLLLFVVAIVSVFVIYFTELSFILQMAIFGVILICSGFIVKYYTSKKKNSYLWYIFSAFMVLLISVNAVSYLYPEESFFIYITLLVNSMLWITVGFKWRLVYFSISGILGVMTILIFIFV